MANSTEDDVLENAGFESDKIDTDTQPVYQMYADGKIPVSKVHGKVWKSRRDAALKQRSIAAGSWDECIRYYNNDQYSRDSDSRGDMYERGRTKNRETENLVYSNASTLLPAVYSKNPKIDISVDQSDIADQDEQDEQIKQVSDFATVLGRLVNKLTSPQYLNLKPKARRQALYAILTNYGWLKLGWNEREFSSDDVQTELAKLADEYGKADTDEKIKEIEGKLIAIEQAFDVVNDAGPFVVVKEPKHILIDPACQDANDLAGAAWVMEDDFLPTSFLQARYMEKSDNETPEYRSIFKPTHIVSSTGTDNSDTTGLRFVNYAGDKDKEADKYDESYYTKVVYVWDKITRRVYLYADADWAWPLWVWDDPLQLSRFFPYFGLAFAPSTGNVYAKSETVYYLDQQDAINSINAQASKVRDWAFNKFLYNRNVLKQSEVERVVNANGFAAEGIDIPEGMKVTDFWIPLLPPSAQHPELFNKDDKYKTIDRMSAVSDALRGTQFKTNTTNDAVNMYADAAKIRVGEKVDCIEDMLADLGRSLAELCVSRYDRPAVAKILSERDAEKWMEMDVRTFNNTLTCSIVAGSTEKPTSAAKQQQAVQIGQVIGQFAKASPSAVIIVLRMLERAFDSVLITKEDFQKIEESIAGQQPGGEQGAEAPELQAALQSLLKVVPPQIKMAIEQATQSGMSPIQAIEAATQHGAQQ